MQLSNVNTNQGIQLVVSREWAYIYIYIISSTFLASNGSLLVVFSYLAKLGSSSNACLHHLCDGMCL